MWGRGHGNVQGGAQTLAHTPPHPPQKLRTRVAPGECKNGVYRDGGGLLNTVLLSPVYAVLLAERCVNVFHTWSMKI